MPPSDMYKKQEDNHSETSGETTTSDSGRGGSESDIQSNGGLSHSYEIGMLNIKNTKELVKLCDIMSLILR